MSGRNVSLKRHVIFTNQWKVMSRNIDETQIYSKLEMNVNIFKWLVSSILRSLDSRICVRPFVVFECILQLVNSGLLPGLVLKHSLNFSLLLWKHWNYGWEVEDVCLTCSQETPYQNLLRFQCYRDINIEKDMRH